MEQTELKIALEGEIRAMKVETRQLADSLARLRADMVDTIATKERLTKEIQERNEDLNKVLNDISQEKLNWMIKKQEELEVVENMKSEAQNVINWKADLNIKEEELRKIQEETIEARNEQRRLELSNKQAVTALEVEKANLEILENQARDKEKIVLQDMQDFKEKILSLIKSVETI